ncbi:MAG: BamA/TamA family outer membrane protein, partial [FCB group bacterium]|nr:BamA/TamA family outer membrane protein [FCB group bacterium]
YHRLWWEKYEPVISLKNRVILQTEGALPIYRQLYMGGKSFVRGYSNIPAENNVSVANRIQVQDLVYHTLEIQQTFLTRKDFNGIETGIDLVIFIDYGYGGQSPKSLKFSKGLLGYGFGLRIFASSLGIIAVDLGFNPHQEGALVHFRD